MVVMANVGMGYPDGGVFRTRSRASQDTPLGVQSDRSNRSHYRRQTFYIESRAIRMDATGITLRAPQGLEVPVRKADVRTE